MLTKKFGKDKRHTFLEASTNKFKKLHLQAGNVYYWKARQNFPFLSYLVQSLLECSLLYTPFCNTVIEKKQQNTLNLCVSQQREGV
jgi:hypothetical protein